MKTGPFSFTDATGQEWFIEGYSRSCGEMYADCRSEDGKALTVRPIAYLAPAGLSLPEGSEKPPPRKGQRRPTAKDRRDAEETAQRLLRVEANIIPVSHSLDCECGNCSHKHYGCLVCGSKGEECTPTSCCAERPPERARAVHCKRETYDVLIDRTTPWGNPYAHTEGTTALYVIETRDQAIDLYRSWIKDRIRAGEPGLIEALAALHGKRLGCWCAPEPCHGDVLADAAEWAVGVLTQRQGACEPHAAE